MRRSFRFLLTTLATLTLLAASTPRAQSGAIRGFPDDALKSQREREEQFRKVPDSARLKEYMTAMAGEPHVAGRPGSRNASPSTRSGSSSRGGSTRGLKPSKP